MNGLVAEIVEDHVVEAIFRFYEGRGFQPTQEERERMLNP